MEALLTASRTSCPESCGLVEPTLEAFEAQKPYFATLAIDSIHIL